jgi:hypothetical protein
LPGLHLSLDVKHRPLYVYLPCFFYGDQRRKIFVPFAGYASREQKVV